jgi:hypothetical protein
MPEIASAVSSYGNDHQSDLRDALSARTGYFEILKLRSTIRAQMKRKKKPRKNGRAAAARAKGRWGTKSKAARSEFASKLVSARWAQVPKPERSKQVPHNGGRPRKYKINCTRYRSHIFSPSTGRCPCGFVRPRQ